MFEIGTVISKGFEGFKANMGPWILAFLAQVAVMVVVYGIFMVLTIVLAQVADFLPLVLMLVFLPVLFALVVVFQMGFAHMALKTARGQPVAVGDLFSQVGKLVPGLITLLICGLPGIIPCIGAFISFMFFGLAIFYVVDKSLDPISAIKASMAATEPARMQMAILLLVTILCVLAGELACGIGVFVAVPTVLIAHAHVYEILSSKAPTA